MSFDIFLMCFRNGRGTTFKRELFEEIFTRGAIDPRLPLTHVHYGYRDGAQIFGGEDDDEIDGLMFNHCGGDTFYAALHELADRSGSFFIWPSDGPQVAIPYQDIIVHLPPEMRQNADIAVVGNGRELEALIRATS